MTDSERVWAKAKLEATALADAGEAISVEQARVIVKRLWKDESLEAIRTEVLDFFATELVLGVSEHRAQKASEADPVS